MQRRQFMHRGAAVAAALLANSTLQAATAKQAAKPLSILILGGTRFIGVHMTELALARGHRVTFFNRGRTRTELFPALERIKGDRNGQLDGLKNRQFDAVIDNSGYIPRHVRLSAELLLANVPRYVFVSSISVYPDFSTPRDETSPVGKLTDETIEKVDNDSYGPLKALCEKAATDIYSGKATVLRPGLIVGPDDNSDRFTYWPARAARGGEIAAPGAPGDGIQIIDVRDLAAFALRTIENEISGTFNLVSPPKKFTIGQLLDESVKSAAALVKPRPKSRVSWIPAEFLDQQKVAPWSDMPVWLPATGTEAAGALTPVQRALDAGMTIRPLANTVRDTLAWHLQRPEAERGKLRAGIDALREQALLKAWKERPR
jgi:2'-hydroxyisoflavone reductase